MKIRFRFLKPDPKYRTKKLAEASVEFTEGLLKGFNLIGFTVNENEQGLFVLFPCYIHKDPITEKKTFFHFLWAVQDGALARLEEEILDKFEEEYDAIAEKISA